MSDNYLDLILKSGDKRMALLKQSREKLRITDENCPLSEDALKIVELSMYHNQLVQHLSEVGPNDGGEYSAHELRSVRDKLNIIAKQGIS